MMIRENKQFKLWLTARAIKLKQLEAMILNDLSDDSDNQDLSDSAEVINALDRELENFVTDLGKPAFLVYMNLCLVSSSFYS